METMVTPVRILILGNMGYVGSVLAAHLRAQHPAAHLAGFDSALFAHALTTPGRMPEAVLDTQHFGDVRAVPPALFRDIDAVVQLAAVSNDPMGDRYAAVTGAINHEATAATARQARDGRVRHYVLASSCSVYGAAGDGARTERDPVSPLTAYARSKIAAEQALAALDGGGMTITCLRFATACGMSPRLRLDLVLNDFVASALALRRIDVLSDGTPWRPLIDVADMARAIEWACARGGDPFVVVNAGADQANRRVADLAHAVATALPGTEIAIARDALPDRRSYRVDFSLFRALAPGHQPRESLADSIAGLAAGLTALGFADPDFRQSDFIRLRMLERHINAGRLTPELYWV